MSNQQQPGGISEEESRMDALYAPTLVSLQFSGQKKKTLKGASIIFSHAAQLTTIPAPPPPPPTLHVRTRKKKQKKKKKKKNQIFNYSADYLLTLLLLLVDRKWGV